MKLEKAKIDTDEKKKEKEIKGKRKNKDPYLTNLNEDPILSYVICQFLDKGIKIGRSPNCQMQLNGLGIIDEHAVITVNKSDIIIKPALFGAKIKINGVNLENSKNLQHMDKILFGNNSKTKGK